MLKTLLVDSDQALHLQLIATVCTVANVQAAQNWLPADLDLVACDHCESANNKAPFGSSIGPVFLVSLVFVCTFVVSILFWSRW
ncbi:hypothetical protein BDV97DRAFT_355258 [Delphinella strobiligena]|nr:hypothetical protein BDV97DRAFT_355258 [Delphinella strobiligena]